MLTEVSREGQTVTFYKSPTIFNAVTNFSAKSFSAQQISLYNKKKLAKWDTAYSSGKTA